MTNPCTCSLYPISARSYPEASALNTTKLRIAPEILPTQTQHCISKSSNSYSELTNPQLSFHTQFFIHQRAYPIIHHALHSLHFPTLDPPQSRITSSDSNYINKPNPHLQCPPVSSPSSDPKLPPF